MDQSKIAVFGADCEDYERVFTPIACVEEVAIGGDGEFGGGVFGGGKVRRDSLDGEVGVDQEALRGGAEARGSPKAAVDR